MVCTTAIILLVFSDFFLRSIGVFVQKPEYTNSKSEIEIELSESATKSELILKVPKSYLTDSRQRNGGKQDFIDIQAILPDMESAGDFLNDKDKSVSLRSAFIEKRIFISLMSPYGHFDAKSYLKTRGYDTKRSNLYGMSKYQLTNCNGKDEASVEKELSEKKCIVQGISEYYVAADEGFNVVFYCDRPEINPTGGCSGISRYKNKPLKYTFRQTQLSDWRDIDRKVRALLDSFFVSEVLPKKKVRTN